MKEAAAAERLLLQVIAPSWCVESQRFLRDLGGQPALAARLDSTVVPVLVDADDRPDLVERYDTTDWPALAVLEPGGEPFWAGGALPPAALLALIEKLRAYYRENGRVVRARVRDVQLVQRDGMNPPRAQATVPLNLRVVRETLNRAIIVFDPDYEGFAPEVGHDGPKFPHCDTIDLLLLAGDLGDGEAAAATARAALHRLMHDGLWDVERGGLARYAAARDWSDIHREQLLTDQAALLSTLVTAAHRLDDADLRADATSLRPAHPDIPPEWPLPPLDATVQVDANARMASALLAAARGGIDDHAAERAAALLDHLWRLAWDRHAGVAHRLAGEAVRSAGFLPDATALGVALLDAYEWFSERRYLDHAETLFEDLVGRFKQGDGAFFDIGVNAAAGRTRYRRRLLDQNAALAIYALRLHEFTRTPWYRQCALHALAGFCPRAAQNGLDAAPYALAVQRYCVERPVLVISGAADHPAAESLRQAALRLPGPWLPVQRLDPIADLETLRRFGINQRREVAAYLCAGAAAGPAIGRPEDLPAAADARAAAA